MDAMTEAAQLWVAYCCADAATKGAAWRNLIGFLVRNPGSFQAITSGGLFNDAAVALIRSAVMRAIARATALRMLGGELVAETITTRFVIMRLGAGLAGMPKIPMPPQAQLALGLAVIVGMSGQAFAEGSSRKEASKLYQEYVATYFIRVIRVASTKPRVLDRLTPPQTFDEWYLENK